MSGVELKAQLITWLASLAEDDPRLETADTIRRGVTQTEPQRERLTLREVAKGVRKHPVWLGKLRVPEVCGEYIAGRRSYELETVLAYLKSSQCRARLAELREERRRQDAARRGRVAP